MRTGRKRKSTVNRSPSGKSRGEPEVVHPETVAVRARMLRRLGLAINGRAEALDALAGSTLGILRLRNRADPGDPGGINEQQFQAGEGWARLVRQHAAVMGYSLGRVGSPSAIMVGGLSCAREPDEEYILTIRRRWSDCYHALMDVCRTHGLAVRDTVYAVCVEDRPSEFLMPENYGQLRIGLNALACVLCTARLDRGGQIRACGEIGC